MAKKSVRGRKASGVAAMETVSDDLDQEMPEVVEEPSEIEPPAAAASKGKRAAKAKPAATADGTFAVGDIKKGAAFANSVGGLDKAISILQILKVAKEVQ
jgi:hypothetical protein